jgi:hypothetical protein
LNMDGFPRLGQYDFPGIADFCQDCANALPARLAEGRPVQILVPFIRFHIHSLSPPSLM